MTSAVDTSVLIDVLARDPAYSTSSRYALTQASRVGALIVCPVVVTELRPAYRDDAQVRRLLLNLEIHVVDMNAQDGLAAGRIQRAYLHAGGRRGRVVADFLIGAHARNHATRLIARDRGFFRDYFEDLEVWYPDGPENTAPLR
ncbi:MAG: type II toxin-antitoxin system VapC family toxin [Alkalispirochaeta sp.]